MTRRERPRLREMILRLGLKPYLVRGEWDGCTAIDDGSGRLSAWLDQKGIPTPADGVRRVALSGDLADQMQRMAAEGRWGTPGGSR